MKAVFLSDAHIQDHADPNLPPLLAFLSYLEGKTERLYIVGDLFDTWFGFPRAVFDEYVPLLGALDKLHRSGTRIIYITGNHDFEMGGYFTNALGAEIHDTEMILEEDGLRALVAHGDMVNAEDRKYRRLRRILRARLTRWLGRNLPPGLVWRIARKLSARYTGEEVASRMPLRAIFHDYAFSGGLQQFDAVILGHLHMPESSEEAVDGRARKYLNLGDWIRWRTFLRWDGGNLSLRQWEWPAGVEKSFEQARH